MTHYHLKIKPAVGPTGESNPPDNGKETSASCFEKSNSRGGKDRDDLYFVLCPPGMAEDATPHGITDKAPTCSDGMG